MRLGAKRKIMLPKILVKAALAKHLNVGRQYDAAGKHAYYYLRSAAGGQQTTATVAGMLARIRSS